MRFINKAFFCVTLACLPAGQLLAHGNPDENWRAVAEQPAADTLQVQVLNSPLGKQLIVANTGSQLLEIFGSGGRPFLQIGPEGVSADFAAPDWYRTQNPGKRQLPPGVTDNASPDWKPVSRETSWGWYDSRLGAVDQHAAKPRWSIPATLDGQPLALTGHLVSMSAARTLFQPRITQKASLSKVKSKIVPDVTPALLLEYHGDNTLVVVDEDGAPLLRLNRSGVYANTLSESWRRLGRAAQNNRDEGWARIASTPCYTWPDARLKRGDKATGNHWQIPVTEDGQDYVISGDWASIEIGQYNSE